MNKFLDDLEKFTIKIRELKLTDETELIIEFIKNYKWHGVIK